MLQLAFYATGFAVCMTSDITGDSVEIKEAQEVLEAAGMFSGFEVMREFPVIFWDQLQHGRIDCAWFRPGKRVPHVVFEIEGIDVQKPSLKVDLRKFRWSRAKHRVIFLYSERRGAQLVDDNGDAKQKVEGRITEIQRDGGRQQQIEVISVDRDKAMAQLLQTSAVNWGAMSNWSIDTEVL